jgi:hypothetical protein
MALVKMLRVRKLNIDLAVSISSGAMQQQIYICKFLCAVTALAALYELRIPSPGAVAQFTK